MRGIPILATLGVLVAFAGLAAAHDFVTNDPATGGGNHSCAGVRNWIGTPGQSIISQGVKVPDPQNEGGEIDVRVYVHLPPHGSPPSQDAGSPLPASAPVRGILWLETNRLTGFQKSEFICSASDGSHGPEGHGDMVLL